MTPWTVAHQAPLSMGFPREERWSGLPFPSPGDLPNPGIELGYPALVGALFTTESPGKPCKIWKDTNCLVPGGQCVLQKHRFCFWQENGYALPEKNLVSEWSVSLEIYGGRKEEGAVVYHPNLLFPRKQSLFCPRAI